MISKSTKSKRRRNAYFYSLERSIRTVQIDQRAGVNFFLVTLPLSQRECAHLEARGEQEAGRQRRKLVEYCRHLERVRAGVDVLRKPPSR